MDRVNYNKIINRLTQERHSLSESKSNDYATHDVLSNFKRISTIARILKIEPSKDPMDYAMFMAIMKIDRIMNLISGGTTPQNEGLEDSFKDLLNYIELTYALSLTRRPMSTMCAGVPLC